MPGGLDRTVGKRYTDGCFLSVTGRTARQRSVGTGLSGHTHGGQLIPLVQLGRRFHIGGNDSVYGLERRNGTDFIVTSGISDWAIKFKTGCRSEFVIVDIKEQ